MRKLSVTLCLTLAVLLGSGDVRGAADVYKALMQIKAGDYEVGIEDLRALAEEGNPLAQTMLGKGWK